MIKLTPALFIIGVLGILLITVASAFLLGANAGVIIGMCGTALAALLQLRPGPADPQIFPPAAGAEASKPDLKIVSGGQS